MGSMSGSLCVFHRTGGETNDKTTDDKSFLHQFSPTERLPMTSNLAHVEDNVGEAFFVVQELCEKFHDFARDKNLHDDLLTTADELRKNCP
jgi:hypothetical protein